MALRVKGYHKDTSGYVISLAFTLQKVLHVACMTCKVSGGLLSQYASTQDALSCFSSYLQQDLVWFLTWQPLILPEPACGGPHFCMFDGDGHLGAQRQPPDGQFKLFVAHSTDVVKRDQVSQECGASGYAAEPKPSANLVVEGGSATF